MRATSLTETFKGFPSSVYSLGVRRSNLFLEYWIAVILASPPTFIPFEISVGSFNTQKVELISKLIDHNVDRRQHYVCVLLRVAPAPF